MTTPAQSDSARRAQRDADDMGATETDEQAAHDHFDGTGEPQRDGLGNEDGAS